MTDWLFHLIYLVVIVALFISMKTWKGRAEELVEKFDYRWEDVCRQLNYNSPKVIMHPDLFAAEKRFFIMRGILHEDGKQEVVCEIYRDHFDEKNLLLRVSVDANGKLWPTDAGPSYLPLWENK